MFLNNTKLGGDIFCQHQLTCRILFNLLCCDGEDTQNFNHNFYNYVHHSRGHSRGPWILDVDLQPPEHIFDTPKDDDECIPTIANSSSSLNDYNIRLVWENVLKLTERSTAMPVKINPAGGIP